MAFLYVPKETNGGKIRSSVLWTNLFAWLCYKKICDYYGFSYACGSF